MFSSFTLITQVLCLALWIGGGMVILAIVVPAVFSGIPETDRAAVIVRPILERFRAVQLVAMIILATTVWIQLIALSPSLSLRLRLTLALISLGILLELYHRFVLSRMLRKAVSETDRDGFKPLHRRSMRIFTVNLFLGIAVVIALITPEFL